MAALAGELMATKRAADGMKCLICSMNGPRK
jgi:hypothetical protein